MTERRPAGEVDASGATLFVRYAFAPNSHGYCGPGDSEGFLGYGLAGRIDSGFRQMAQAFAGAWPYLELIAGATGISDPLDCRVVEAYWVGNRLLDRVGVTNIGNSMEDRFRFRTGIKFSSLAAGVEAGGLPHHSFHVFCIYPWIGLLGEDRRAEHALTVLDRCRIRWGQVVALQGDQVVVESQALSWTGSQLVLGAPAREIVIRAVDGVGMVQDLAEGDWVSMHWEWICDRLTPRELAALRHYTDVHLGLVNGGVEHSGPRLALG
ncbi:DUF6390 family protein [Flexivirga alba]|uniref:DUF6390 family protein n=1 Tax=Flexivirga alba TaxID=702742 RepID=A0ABW2AKH8_9MICO